MQQARHRTTSPRSAREEGVPAPRNPFYALFVANQGLRAFLAIALRDAPIRSDEYGVYSAVFVARSLTPTQLARSTGMPLTTVADYLRAMEERGHLLRRPNPADRRSVLLSLSPAGDETVRAVMPIFTSAVRMINDELTVPGDELLAALDAFAAATERAMDRLSTDQDG